MPKVALERFKEAQDSPHAGFHSALNEIRHGAKRGHWIWYVFPQLDGLGSSELARVFAIRGREEAEAFLRDAELRTRLVTISRAVADQLEAGRPASLRVLMGSDIDARKIVSSLTLFGYVARALDPTEECVLLADVADKILTRAAAEGYPRCAYTLRRLTRSK